MMRIMRFEMSCLRSWGDFQRRTRLLCALWGSEWMLSESEDETPGTAELLYRADALRFVRERLKFKPDAKQAAVMGGKIRRGLMNCTRQWGKSTLTAAMAVHRAWTAPESLTIAVSPSARQTG